MSNSGKKLQFCQRREIWWVYKVNRQNHMNSILILVGIVLGFVILLNVWNKYSRKYNYGILRNSTCKSCGEVLGNESLDIAIPKLKEEKEQLKQNAKIGTVKLHNMELVCSNCGTINFERDLYKANREKVNNAQQSS
jgi:hypothetical protein